MTVRKTDVSTAASRVQSPLWSIDKDKTISSAAYKTIVTKAEENPRIGKVGARVLAAAYLKAKTAAGGPPTREALQREVSKAAGSLANERGAKRVNDGYVDAREAGAIGNPVADALFTFLNGPAFAGHATTAGELAVSASKAQIDKAVKNLLPVVDAGLALARPHEDDYDLWKASFRKAATSAGLSGAATAALMTALNGATSRGDGDSLPGAASIKALLTNAAFKLKAADGALIVDLARPTKAPTSKRDGKVTGLEVDRTPAVTGMTSRAVLKYASTL